MATKRPNIILIMTDQHRYDRLGCMGDPLIQTPHLDGLAHEGVVFDRAYTASPVCGPARAALKSGMDFTPVPITVTDSDITDLLIERITEPTLGSIAGQVNIVNAPGGLKTSVVLMAEETFIPGFDKGEMIPGLRAPAPPEPPSITGAYTITGIPAGNYVVLAAFENDYLVRDPDPGIAGTQILHLSIPDGGGNWNL